MGCPLKLSWCSSIVSYLLQKCQWPVLFAVCHIGKLPMQRGDLLIPRIRVKGEKRKECSGVFVSGIDLDVRPLPQALAWSGS
jgi:hypothetical protein